MQLINIKRPAPSRKKVAPKAADSEPSKLKISIKSMNKVNTIGA